MEKKSKSLKIVGNQNITTVEKSDDLEQIAEYSKIRSIPGPIRGLKYINIDNRRHTSAVNLRRKVWDNYFPVVESPRD